MSWTQVIEGFDAKIANDCRAGILVGCQLPISDNPDVAPVVQGWTKARPGTELWIVDDLLGLAPQQPIYVGIPILQAFALDDDPREGIASNVLSERMAEASSRMTGLLPELSDVLRLQGQTAGPVGSYFVWSGPLCGGFLAKGVFREKV